MLGALADRYLRALLLVVPATIGLALIALRVSGDLPIVGYLATVLWGAAFGGILNLVQLWGARLLPDRVEVAGGLVVGAFQSAIIVGSAIGGRGVDGIGLTATYGAAAVAAVLGGILLWHSLSRAPR